MSVSSQWPFIFIFFFLFFQRGCICVLWVIGCSSPVHWSTPEGMQAVVAPRASSYLLIHSQHTEERKWAPGYDRYQRRSTEVPSSKVHPEAVNSPLRGNTGRNVQNARPVNVSPHSVARAESDRTHTHTHTH